MEQFRSPPYRLTAGECRIISCLAIVPTSPRHSMCRSIKTLFNFEPPVTDEEIRAASLQFVRKICGFTKPSQANEAAFLSAVDEIAGTSRALLGALQTSAPMK